MGSIGLCGRNGHWYSLLMTFAAFLNAVSTSPSFLSVLLVCRYPARFEIIYHDQRCFQDCHLFHIRFSRFSWLSSSPRLIFQQRHIVSESNYINNSRHCFRCCCINRFYFQSKCFRTLNHGMQHAFAVKIKTEQWLAGVYIFCSQHF